MVTAEEKRNNSIAILLSVLIHAMLLLIFVFTIAWRAPNPPLPEYGFELNLGTDPAGSGDVQTQPPSGSESPAETTLPENQPSQPEQPEATTATQPDESQTDSKHESPVAIPEAKKEETVKTEKPVEKAEKKVEKTPAAADTKPIEKTEEKKEAPAKPLATYEGKPQGDKPKTAGDQGNPQGKPDARALYGQPGGGGGGVQLDLAGWTWDYIPTPDIPPSEPNGRIVIEIKVNDEGEIIERRVIENSSGPEALKVCFSALDKLTFNRTDGGSIPTVTVGRITFLIRSR